MTSIDNEEPVGLLGRTGDDEEIAFAPKGNDGVVYDPVAANDDDDDEQHQEQLSLADHSIETTTVPRWRRFLSSNILPDNRFELYGHRIVDGPAAVKFLKLLVLTFVSITVTFHYVRWVGYLEHDSRYTLQDFWHYEATLVVCDILVFFVVGRLYRQRGVDHFDWLSMALLCNLYSSYSSLFPFLKHSATLYEMHCRWPWTLWAFLGIIIPVVVAVVFLHVRHAMRMKVVWLKLLELALSITFFMLPYVSNPYYHLHHWYVGWLVGMHFNFDVWWSRAAMAWCFGAYVNGIAVWGRDPVLTCGYSLHLSMSQRCPYLKCYLDGINVPKNDTNHTHVEPMVTPDWRNCSASSYHP